MTKNLWLRTTEEQRPPFYLNCTKSVNHRTHGLAQNLQQRYLLDYEDSARMGDLPFRTARSLAQKSLYCASRPPDAVHR